MKQEAACTNYNPGWDPNSVLAIPTQSRQSQDIQLLLEITFRIKPKQPIWHPTKPEWISHRRSYDIHNGDDHTGSAGRKHLGAHLPAENRSWRSVDERTLDEITSRANKCTWRRVNSATGDETTSELRNDDVDTQTSDSKHTCRKSGQHSRRWMGERNQQLEISALSTGRMSSVPTSAPTRRIISATARARERWWDDQASLIYAERVHLCLPHGFPKGMPYDYTGGL